jgi:hypothetical protein
MRKAEARENFPFWFPLAPGHHSTTQTWPSFAGLKKRPNFLPSGWYGGSYPVRFTQKPGISVKTGFLKLFPKNRVS